MKFKWDPKPFVWFVIFVITVASVAAIMGMMWCLDKNTYCGIRWYLCGVLNGARLHFYNPCIEDAFSGMLYFTAQMCGLMILVGAIRWIIYGLSGKPGWFPYTQRPYYAQRLAFVEEEIARAREDDQYFPDETFSVPEFFESHADNPSREVRRKAYHLLGAERKA